MARQGHRSVLSQYRRDTVQAAAQLRAKAIGMILFNIIFD